MKIYLKLGTLLFTYGLLSPVAFAANPIEKTTSCDIAELADMKGKVTLSPQCVYQGGVVISSSNVTLDCQGATFDGGGKVKYGVLIDGRGMPISNITVENCNILNYADTAVVVRGLKKSQVSADQQENYTRSPSNVVIRNVVTDRNRRSGVYFDDYVFNSSLQNSTVKGSGGVGVYLDQGTKGITLQNNVIESNGRAEGRKSTREGVAIDSSAKNIIKDNTFRDNGAGGIFLYKNCGERYNSKNGILRWQSSNDNLIENNTFVDEKVGVWLASRQSKDLSKWGCGDQSVDVQKKYYRDYANYNTVRGNKFCRVNVAVRNEGDNNRVESNAFDAEPKKMIVLPFQNKPKPSGELSVGNINDRNIQSGCDVD